jgi:hypothetical protein
VLGSLQKVAVKQKKVVFFNLLVHYIPQFPHKPEGEIERKSTKKEKNLFALHERGVILASVDLHFH